jgi:hypothetical protein
MNWRILDKSSHSTSENLQVRKVDPVPALGLGRSPTQTRKATGPFKLQREQGPPSQPANELKSIGFQNIAWSVAFALIFARIPLIFH